MITAGVLLVATLAILWWFARGDLAEYRRFKALNDTRSRQMRYRLWVVKAVLAFALPPLVGLVLLGRVGALVERPDAFAPLAGMLPAPPPEAITALLTGGAIGAVGGALVLVAVARLRRRRAVPVRTIGDIASLLPRNRAELRYGGLLALSAGVTEELMFRLWLPLLVTILSGSALIGFVAATAIFGVMHRYQGWAGIVATSVLGVLLSGLYLVTGLLWLVMLFHVLIDLNALVLRPVLNGVWRR